MPQNVAQKARQRANTVQTVQASLNIQGPSKKSGNGSVRQLLHESLRVGNSGKARRAPKIGKNHVRDSMGL